MSARLDLDAVRANADRCPALARLVSDLDLPGRDESKVRESITYHFTVAHQTCPALPEASVSTSPGQCAASAIGGYLRCHLPYGHDGAHESRLFIWT